LILILLGILLVGGGIYIAISNIPQAVTYDGKEVKYLVPHMASFKCDVTGSSTSSHMMSERGIWLSIEDIGINTNLLKNIKVELTKDPFFQPRLKLNICDANKQNCGGEEAINFKPVNYGIIELNDLDLTRYSYYLYTEVSTVFSWKYFGDAKVTYTYDKFGLTLASTTNDPAGEIICSTSCDLSCPSQKYRDKIVSTPETTLNFYETAPYLEFWDAPALVGDQLGGTYWIPTKQQFCFGGYIYNAGTLTMENGDEYIYPKSYVTKKDCCPGAVLSITNGQKICQNDFTWKTITDNDKIPCTSVYQCPGQGKDTCNLISGKYIKSSYSCSNGYCEQGKETQVACCPPDLGCPEDQVCDGSYKCVGGSPNPPVDPRKEICDDKIDNDGDGLIDEADPDCKTSECGAWIKIAGKTIIPDIFCLINLWIQKFRITLAIVLGVLGGLLGGLFSMKFIEKKKLKSKWWIILVVGLVLGGAIGFLAYTYFWTGILVLVVFGLIKAFVPGI
jgi:hypothetical protein